MTIKLLSLIPPHRYYIEVFGGGASLLFAKRPALVETYNDLDHGLVSLFRVLRDESKFAKFYKLVSGIPYARSEYNYCRSTWEETEDEIEKAVKWYVVARMSFSGIFVTSWGSVVTKSNRKRAETVSGWLMAIENLPAIHKRLVDVQIECSDWRIILDRYHDGENYLAYLDPPYMAETRKSGGYKHEMTKEDHEELIQRIIEYPSMAMLSAYPHELYNQLSDHGWEKTEFKTACSIVGRTRASGIQGKGSAMEMQPRTEVVWRNPMALEKWRRQKGETLFELHDLAHTDSGPAAACKDSKGTSAAVTAAIW